MSAIMTRAPELIANCVDATIVSRAQEVMDRALAKKRTVVTAESCTGGLIAAALSYATGAATQLHGCFVVYTKEHKHVSLGVSRDTLLKRGSVNSDVARQLVEGALNRSPADVAVGVTGVLGPEPDEDGSPVGLVFFGYGRRGGPIEVVESRLPPSQHDHLRRITVLRAFECIERALMLP